MTTTSRKWTGRFREYWRPLLDALSGADDPYGEELRRLEGRVRLLESEITALRPSAGTASTGATQAE
jgi:hypothetical protein